MQTFKSVLVQARKVNSIYIYIKRIILIYFYNAGYKKKPHPKQQQQTPNQTNQSTNQNPKAGFQEFSLCIYLCDLGNYIVTPKWRHGKGSTSNLVIP